MSDIPDKFDPSNLQHLAVLLDHLRIARVRRFDHPCGLSLELDTRASANVTRPEPTDGEF